MSDKVFLTGGLGYIGGRLSAALEQTCQWEPVIGTRRSDPGPAPWLSRGVVVPTAGLTIAERGRLLRGCRAVVHLAAMNEVECVADLEGAVEGNVVESFRWLQAAESAGVEKFIFFSTAQIYGPWLVGTIDESCLPRPVHPYGVTHKAAEEFVLAARASNRIDGIVVRPSNCVGRPMHAGVNRWMIVGNDLCRQAVTTHKLKLKTAGIQRRDFVTLTDVCAATAHLLSLPRAASGEGVFNLSGEASLRIIDFASVVAARCKLRLGFEPIIEHPPVGPGEQSSPLDYRMDRLRQTGYVLKGSLEDEIDDTLLLCHEAFGHR